LPDATGALEVAERRVRARTAIIPPVYVNLENTNGGLAFNMSEDGIALTAALAMASDGTIAMRIPIPDSQGWMEASGRLAWRSESGKTAGITFLGLPDDSRERIRQWLAAETSASEPRPEEGMLAKSEKRALDAVPAEPPMVPAAELLKANSVVEKRILEAILSEHRLASMDVRAKVPVSRERPERELEEQTVKRPDGPAEHLDLLENPKLEIFPSGKAPSVGAVQQGWQALVCSEIAVPGGDELPPTADAFRALRRRFSTSSEFKPRPRPSLDRITSGTRIGKLRRVAAVVAFAGATGVGIGWVAARRSIRNEVATSVALNTEGASQPVKTSRPWKEAIKDRVPQPEKIGSPTQGFEPLPSPGLATDSETRLVPRGPQIHGMERPAASPVVNGPARHTANSVPESPPGKLPERAVVASRNPAVEDARSQVVEGSPVQPTGNAASQATSPSASVAGGTAVGEVKERESPPPLLEQPAAAAAPVWSVAVSPDPYPSIRMSQDINSQKPSSIKSLEIGRVISRVEPDYPEEAKNQGIEGTVKLHVVVGHDGSVESVEPISGQVLLLKAAMSAVREWHYAQTLLGGQPVETEQDIVVKFQRASPSISKN
jgi:TonB family protein